MTRRRCNARAPHVVPASLLNRKAVVYVRQSTQTQVQMNLESQRRQYDLVEVARRHGFAIWSGRRASLLDGASNVRLRDDHVVQ